MAEPGETRIQLCGRFVARLEGERVENALPGTLGQLLFAYLVLNRLRRIDRDELLIAIYGEEAASDHHARLSVLLSKLRRVVGAERVTGRAHIELTRPLLPGHDRPWLDQWRRRLDDARISGLECVARACLGIGGAELAQAANCARQLIELALFRETGHRILMETLEQTGNVAEALRVDDSLRVTLRDELGIAPSPALQDAHRRLLGTPATTTV